MTHFNKSKLRIALVALTVVSAASATTASAQAFGVPLLPHLEFPKKGAFEGKSGKCVLFVCSSKPQVTKNAVTTKLGE